MFRGWFSQPFMRIAFHCILLIRRITRSDCLIRMERYGSEIGAVTIEKMSEEYGSNPKDLKVAIGPSICQECYEVSEDVIEEFERVFDKKYRNKLFYRKENGKYQLNLWMANKIIFLEAGIPEETFPCQISVPAVILSFSFLTGFPWKKGKSWGFSWHTFIKPEIVISTTVRSE